MTAATISPAVAEGLRRRRRGFVVHAMVEWEEGEFLQTDDSVFLQAAAAQNLTLATYDRRTIPPLLKTWAEAARNHGGVIFVDEKTISPANIGGLVLALDALAQEAGAWDWTNRVCFLQK